MREDEERLDEQSTVYRDGKNFCLFTGKRAYPDQAKAESVADHQESKGSPPLACYFCGACRYWHLARE